MKRIFHLQENQQRVRLPHSFPDVYTMFANKKCGYRLKSLIFKSPILLKPTLAVKNKMMRENTKAHKEYGYVLVLMLIRPVVCE